MTLSRLGQILQRRWLLILLVAVAVASLAGLDTSKTFLSSGSRVYGSTGKLLLRRDSARVRALKTAIVVQPARGTPADVVFFDPEQARRLVEDEKFLQKVQAHLKGPLAELPVDKLQVRILLSPAALGFQQLVAIQDESGQENLEELEDLESIDLETDYFKRGALRVLTLSVWGETPEDSRALARATMEELQKEVRRRASLTYTTRRQNEEGLYRKMLDQVVKAEKALRRLNPSPLSAEEQEARFQLLENARLQMRFKMLEEVGRVEALRANSRQPLLAAGANEASSALNVFRDDLSRLERKLAADARVYPADSSQIQSTKAQFRHVQELVDEHWEQLHDSLRNNRVARLMAYRQRLRELDEEVAGLRSDLGSDSRRRQARREAAALDHWEAAARLQLGKVYKARVEEQVAQNRGTLVTLQVPQLGVDISGAARLVQANKTVARLALFPAGLFFGLLLAVGVDLWHRRFALTARIQRELRLPILATLPPLEIAETKRWKAMKRSIFATRRRTGDAGSEED